MFLFSLGTVPLMLMVGIFYNLTPDGCNPIGIEERIDEDGIIIIGTEQLKELKDKFENWKGPKL